MKRLYNSDNSSDIQYALIYPLILDDSYSNWAISIRLLNPRTDAGLG